MKNFIWVVEINDGAGWKPFVFADTRTDAREAARYFNGFAHGKKHARNRVSKYVRAE
jgi:hypothetical protein